MQWHAPAVRSDDPPWPLEPFVGSAPLRLGVLINLGAKGLRRTGDRSVRELAASAGGRAEVAATRDATEAKHAIDGMLGRGVNVLALAGGDGTVHHALQSLSKHGSIWPGAMLPIPFGTLNIVASSLARLGCRTTLRGWTERTWGELPRRTQRLLRVTGERSGARHGFLFGSEMVKLAVELYDRFGGGYRGLSRLLLEVARGYYLHTPLWKQESWRLTAPSSGVTVDGELCPVYSAVAVASCDMAVLGGAIRALEPPGDTGFSARVITEVRTGALLKLIPSLMRQGRASGVREFPLAERVELSGSYTLDGECFGESARGATPAEVVTVESGGAIQVVR